MLGRSRSTISREIKRGKYFNTNYYIGEHAHRNAKFFNNIKHLYPKIKECSTLRFYVYRGLLKGWSPEQIANRIKHDYPKNPEMRISYESIYSYIYRRVEAPLNRKPIKLLPYRKPKWSGLSHWKVYVGTILDRTSIDERPDEIEKRQEIGHWESDLIIGKGQTSAIGTIVERKSRYTIIVPLKSIKSEHVVMAFAKELLRLPTIYIKTITHNNGIEMASHKLLSKLTQMTVCFTHPYSSWERGTNENTNGLIRRVFKKKTDFNKVSVKQLKTLQDNLNEHPRKVIGYFTPNEIMNYVYNI